MSWMRIAALSASVLLTVPAGADDDVIPWFHETISLKGGAIFAFLDTDVEVSGRHFDVESDFDLDEFEVMPSLEARWRFTRNRRHRLELGYFAVLRSATVTTPFAIDLPDGPSIPAGARTKTTFDVHIATLTYGYSILHDERKELGIFLGLDFIVADAELEGSLSTPGGVVIIEDDLIDENFDVPFPTAGVYFNWAFTKKLALLTRFQYFGLKFQGVTGELYRGNFRVQHQTFKHLDLYVGYDVLGASVDFDGSFENLSLVYHGPTAGIDIRF